MHFVYLCTYRYNAISGRENEYICTGNDPGALPLHGFLDGIQIPKVAEAEAPVSVLF